MKYKIGKRWPWLLLLCSHLVMSDSLWPHGLQQAWLLCLLLSPRVCSNLCALSQWCHPTISSSVALFSSCLQPFPASGSFLISGLFTLSGQNIEASVQSFQWIFRIDFLQDWLVWSPCSPWDSQESSPTPQFKSISSSALSLLYGPISHPYVTTGKIIALTVQSFVGKEMSAF